MGQVKIENKIFNEGEAYLHFVNFGRKKSRGRGIFEEQVAI